MKKRITRSSATTFAELAGIGMLLAGFFTISITIGLVAGGIVLVLAGFLLA